MSKSLEGRIIVKVFFLCITLYGVAFCIIKGHFDYLWVCMPLVAYSVWDMYKMIKKAQNEVDEFVESIHYRDFSRNFNVKKAPIEVRSLRQGFNEINATFRQISREKELQYQYLQQILELVDTGILSYQVASGEVNWVNSTFKKMLNTPYLKTIQGLEKRDEQILKAVLAIRPNETQVITVQRENRQMKLLLAATFFQVDNKTNKLIAFQNIYEALDENEAQAWQKLLSVMTHEIMNSVAPIASLADTLKKNLEQPISENDLAVGLETIKKRSEGLLKFTESYRNLNKNTELRLSKTYVGELIENILTLMNPTLEQRHIQMDIILKDPLLVAELDVNLIEQVLINLLVNAIEAVKERENPQIILSAYQEDNKILIKIADNGIGIAPNLMDKIFIPFFSTKKTGSGIGLSLCKQIMLLHKGSIQVQSIEGQGSVFILQFLEPL